MHGIYQCKHGTVVSRCRCMDATVHIVDCPPECSQKDVTYAVQFGKKTDTSLDFTGRDADSLEDGLGYVREAAATNPEFEWDVIMIWRGRTSVELAAETAQMEADQAKDPASEMGNRLLRELMEAMGESQHARSQTPQGVWNEMLDKVRERFGAH